MDPRSPAVYSRLHPIPSLVAVAWRRRTRFASVAQMPSSNSFFFEARRNSFGLRSLIVWHHGWRPSTALFGGMDGGPAPPCKRRVLGQQINYVYQNSSNLLFCFFTFGRHLYLTPVEVGHVANYVSNSSGGSSGSSLQPYSTTAQALGYSNVSSAKVRCHRTLPLCTVSLNVGYPSDSNVWFQATES